MFADVIMHMSTEGIFCCVFLFVCLFSGGSYLPKVEKKLHHTDILKRVILIFVFFYI